MMPEDAQDPKLPDPAEENLAPGTAPSQPSVPGREESSSSTAASGAAASGASASSARQAEDSEYILEIRELLRKEGLSRRTGSLMRRLTGSLRRMTGPLRSSTGPLRGPTGPLPPPRMSSVQSLPVEPADQAEEPQPPAQPLTPMDASDDFMVNRLTGHLGRAAGDDESPSSPLPELGLPEEYASPIQPEYAPREEMAPQVPLFADEDEIFSDLPGVLDQLGMTAQSPEEAAPSQSPRFDAPDSGAMAQLRQGMAADQLPDLPQGPSSEETEPAAPAGEPTQGGDYMSEIRESLRTEGRGKTGGLIRRITSSLRRVTGSLRKPTGPLPDEKAQTPEIPELLAPQQTVIPSGVSDEFLRDRLTGAPAEELAAPPPAEAESFPEDFFKPVGEVEESPSLESLFAAQEETAPDTSKVLSDLGMPEQPEAEELEPDWMAELRQETAAGKDPAAKEPPTSGTQAAAPVEPEAPEAPGEKPAPRGSGPLSFITGILRRPEEKRKPKQTGGLSDEMVSGRLERSLSTGPTEPHAPQAPEAEPPAPEAPASLPASQLPASPLPPSPLPPAPQTPAQGEEISFEDLFYGDTGVLKPHTGMLDLPPETGDRPVSLFGDQPGIADLGEPAAEQDTTPLFSEEEIVIDEDADLLEGLESRFGQFGEDVNEPITGLMDEPGLAADVPDISVEEGAQLWSEEAPREGTPVDGVTFTPEDVWGEEELPPADQPPSRSRGLSVDEAIAASFLTGETVLPESPLFSQDQLLREALERTAGEEQPIPSYEELRSVALQDYQELDLTAPRTAAQLEEELQVAREMAARAAAEQEAAARAAQQSPEEIEAEKARSAAAEVTAAAVEEFEREEQQNAPFSLGRWLATRTPVQKFLLAEAAVVALALLVAVPFFIYLIVRGPVQRQVVGSYPAPKALPANVPHPTGLELPGGWSFQLQKSTFIKGQWTPETSEWLEGTELRRVVALPWNPQTEAVVNTFEKGDKVQVRLSNGKTVQYTVDEVKRITANNSAILTDPNPSLVIILYQEKSAERWVVFCKP